MAKAYTMLREILSSKNRTAPKMVIPTLGQDRQRGCKVEMQRQISQTIILAEHELVIFLFVRARVLPCSSHKVVDSTYLGKYLGPDLQCNGELRQNENGSRSILSKCQNGRSLPILRRRLYLPIVVGASC